MLFYALDELGFASGESLVGVEKETVTNLDVATVEVYGVAAPEAKRYP